MKPVRSDRPDRSAALPRWSDAGWLTLLIVAAMATPLRSDEPHPGAEAGQEAVLLPTVGPDNTAEGDADRPWQLIFAPQSLLWQPPLAMPGQPRSYALLSTAREYYTEDTVETALGGTVGLLRYAPDAEDSRHGVQVDFFGVVLSRFSHTSRLLAADYRAGVIGTFAWGEWEGKGGYEHTSTHIGDEYVARTGDFRRAVIRDELVIALAYRWQNLVRFYAQGAYTFDIRTPNRDDQRDRWNFGLEIYRNEPTPWWGQPYFACDLDLRGDQDYHANVTVQGGWMWRDPERRPFLRLLTQYYSGRSPYGHFSDETESWVAFGIALDY